MSTIGMVRDLAGFFLWVGIAGAAVAVLCAIIVAIAISVGSAGVAGGSGAVWIGGTLLSLTAGFSGQWIPLLAAAGALLLAVVLGPIARRIVRAYQERPKPEPVSAPAGAAAASTASGAPRMVSVRTVASESIR
jgi:hypothetical protein